MFISKILPAFPKQQPPIFPHYHRDFAYATISVFFLLSHLSIAGYVISSSHPVIGALSS